MTANGTRLFYESAGVGPAVVLIHGGDLDRRMWDPQFLVLARDHRVIRYDLRGYGKSARRDGPYRAQEDLRALLDALHVAHASLVGHSGGGRIAIDFALAWPERVERLVLAAPGISGWQFARGDTSWFPEARAARARGDSAGIALAWLQQDFVRAAMDQPDVAERLRRIARDQGQFWVDVLRDGKEWDEEGSPPALHRTKLIAAPTLLIVGTRDTQDIYSIADSLTSTVRAIQRVTFDGAGHMLNLERADRFTTLVRDFLRP